MALNAAVAVPATAAATAEARWSNLKITVVDTNLRDGVEAGYSLSTASMLVSSSSLQPDFEYAGGEGFRADGVTWSESLHHTYSLPTASGGEISAEGGAGAGDIREVPGYVKAGISGEGTGGAVIWRYLTIDMKKNTRLDITLDVEVTLQRDGTQPGASLFAEAVLGNVPTAAPGRSLTATLGPEENFQSLSRTLSFSVGSGPGFSSTTFVTYARASVSAGVPPVPGVPEPSTYALLAGGLGLLGWRARGRRSTAS
ncbi:hypothetical protein AAW51_2760 [Caldimonas brevitalea]|uniref:Ice-binding protein C-terminal domain-containing protein n=1 Tax=Caldimonas brevitalea TaxID=413882 RepID=A0A0G3BQ24_9BURK|nr:hypothetical protein AAW51_2760 [Caldimonas brevitalea]